MYNKNIENKHKFPGSSVKTDCKNTYLTERSKKSDLISKSTIFVKDNNVKCGDIWSYIFYYIPIANC